MTENIEKDVSNTPNTKMCKFRELFQFLHGSDKLLLIIGTLTAVLAGISMPAFVFFFGQLTDSFDPAKSGENTLREITRLSKIYLIIGGIIWILSFIFFSFWKIISHKVGYEFRWRYLKAILNQEAAWYDEKDPLELPTQISNECAKIEAATGEKFVIILNFMSQAIGGFIIAFVIGWKYSFAALGVFPFLVVGIVTMTIGIKMGYAKSTASYAKSAAFAEQALNNIKVVSAFGQEEREIKNYVSHLDEAKKQGQIGKAIIAFSIGIFNFLIFLCYAYGLFVGGQFVKAEIFNHNKGRVYTSGDIIAIFFGILIGIFASGSSATNIKVVSEGRISAFNALEIINRVPKILLDDERAMEVNNILTDIKFNEVSFKYTTREEKALDNFTCTIEKGKTTAFVGPSGSGKSTVVKLLERFYDPDEGRITVNGQDLKNLNLRQYRHRIGYVGQEPVLFNESIKDNMLNAKPDASEDEIIHALTEANAMGFINKLSEGIKTNAGASGGQLSGGEKQRIALARAFLKKPDLLILDEATSALDRRNETEIQKAIENINKQNSITTVAIAHRLSTIKNADKIVVIDKGEIKEVGTHSSLLEEYPEGIYSKLVNTQQNVESSSVVNVNSQEHDNSGDMKQNSQTQTDALKKLEKQVTEEVNREEEEQDKQITEMRTERKKKGFFKRLCQHNRPLSFVFIGLLSSMVAGSLHPIFAVFWSKILFVMMDIENMGPQLLKYCGILLGIAFISLLSIFISKFLFGSLGETMSRNIREETYTTILRKHVGWFDSSENTPGQLSTILSTEVNTLNGASSESVALMFESFSGLLIGVGLSFFFEWRISLVALGVTPLMIISAVINSKVEMGSMNDVDTGDAEVNNTVSETIINYTTVGSFANEGVLLGKYKKVLGGSLRKEIVKSYISGVVFGFGQFMTFGMFTALFWSGAKFVERYDVDPQDLFTAIFIMMFAAMGAGQAQQHGPQAGKGVEAAAKIYNIIDEPSLIDPFHMNHNEHIATKDTFKGRIEFKDVWFRYPTRTDNWILKGLNITIRPNECVGLVGQSGGGKSTIVQLLYRFYDPQKGQILIDGIDIKQYNIRSLRAQFGLVQQEPVLFNYSVKDNISYAKEGASCDEIREAAIVANAHDFIQDIDAESESKLEKSRFPDSAMQPLKGSDFDLNSMNDLPSGYSTLCGVKGSKFSGGQKQRIAVARAIISKPQLLMLDEATSALDEESQHKVQEALDKVMTETTSIVIAHRLTTIRKCDRLIVLDQGVMSEEGSYDELMRAGGQFAHISSDMQS